MLHGVLVIDKPQGPTSHDVVQRVRRRLGVARAGHTGTLDPMATGVLPVVLGEATKLVPLLIGGDKVYEAEATLGVETDTLDAEGRVVATAPPSTWPAGPAPIAAAVEALAGRRLQPPPAYSAVKVDGRPLHERARRGEVAQAAPREVVVHEAVCLGVEPGPAPGPIGGGPRVRFRVTCSKGTYVRVLAADLGRALGCGAYLSSLRRLRSGPFGIEQALPLARLDSEAGRAEAEAALVSPAGAIADLPALETDAAGALRLSQGQPIAWPDGRPLPAAGSSVRVAAPDRPLVALAEVRVGPGGAPLAYPTRVFADPGAFTRPGPSGIKTR